MRKWNFKIQIPRSMGLFLVFWNILGLIIAANVGFFGISAVQTQNFFIHPSDPINWTQQDPTIQLQTRMYFPPFFSSQNHYPGIFLFHGVTRSLEDNDYFARRLAQEGVVCLAISFRGHGLSNGTFPVDDGNLYNISFGDAAGAYRYLQNLSYIDPTHELAFGISMGGAAAIYLAISDLIPKFVAWYPATGEIWGSQPLYNCSNSDPAFQGFVMAGTADQCSICLPNMTQTFINNNPQVQLQWLQGAVHTDGRFYWTELTTSLQWITNLWGLPSPDGFIQWYYAGYLGILIGGIVVAVDGILGIRAIVLRYKKNHIKPMKKR